MKYLVLVVVFILGFFLGRFSLPSQESQSFQVLDTVTKKIDTDSDQPKSSPKYVENSSLEVSVSEAQPQDPKFVRTDSKLHNKRINELFSLMIEAGQNSDIESQNKFLNEMQLLDPRHEKVYQAKALFLEEDDDWQGAHKLLKECVANIPQSLYCLRRLANIRTSTMDEKLEYGLKCLELEKNDPLCLVDVAMALQIKGEFQQAKSYFEKALLFTKGGAGYNRNYLLFNYGLNLESLRLNQQAKDAFTQSCRLNFKPACGKLATL